MMNLSWWLLILAYLVSSIGGIIIIAVAAQNSLRWTIALIVTGSGGYVFFPALFNHPLLILAASLLPAALILVFVVKHWHEAKVGLFFLVAAFLIRVGSVAAAIAATGGSLEDVLAGESSSRRPKDKDGKRPVDTEGVDLAAEEPARPPANQAAPRAAAVESLDTPEQVRFALADLHQQSRFLRDRKQSMELSRDEAGLALLAGEIQQYNERLRRVTARATELKILAPPAASPTPTPALAAAAAPPPAAKRKASR